MENTPQTRKELKELTKDRMGFIPTSQGKNREMRREILQKKPFFGQSLNHHLSIHRAFKYLRVQQNEKTKDGTRKVINHYILQP